MTALTSNSLRHIQAARLRACQSLPYFGTDFWACALYERPGLSGIIERELGFEGFYICTDNEWRIYYDPKLILDVDPMGLAWDLTHEIMHCQRRHGERFKALVESPTAEDREHWCLACEAEIDDDIMGVNGIRPDRGCILPGNPPDPKKMFGRPPMPTVEHMYLGLPENRLAEEYYWMLKKRAEDEGRGGKKPKICISCVGLGDLEKELGAGISVRPGVGKYESEMIRTQVAKEVREWSRAHGAGSVPAGILRWATGILEPRVPWRRELAAVFRWAMLEVIGQSDYSWMRPSRVQDVTPGVLLPALADRIPRVGVVADTSASMDDEQETGILSEVKGIIAALGFLSSVVVLACDAAVKAVSDVFDAKRVKLIGGGGTDMGVGIHAALAIRPALNVIVVITDGFTPWPEKPPRGTKVVVVLVGPGSSPKWARTINLFRRETL
jgi:predicted metal-dependent peptidase